MVKKMVMMRGKVGLYSNTMAAQAIKPKKAAGREQSTRIWKAKCLAVWQIFILTRAAVEKAVGKGKKRFIQHTLHSFSFLPEKSHSHATIQGNKLNKQRNITFLDFKSFFFSFYFKLVPANLIKHSYAKKR